MAYEIRKTNGNLFVTVDDGTLNDSSAPITFVGKRYPEYGLVLNQNDLYTLENFANSIPPTNPMIGQLWYDTTPNLETLKVYTGGTSGWRSLGFSENFASSEITGNINFLGNVTYTGQVTYFNFTEFRTLTSFIDTIQFTEGAKFTGSLVSEAQITFDGSTTFNDATTFNGGVSFGDANAINFDAELTMNAKVDFNQEVNVIDNEFTIADNIDNSKKVKFELSNLSSVSTRVLDVPNASGTLVLENNTANLSNKTISSSIFNKKVKTLVNTNGSSSGDQTILVDSSVSSLTVTLSSADVISGRDIFIIDIGGNASNKKVTIQTEGSETINGFNTIDLGVNFGYVKLTSNGTNWFASTFQINTVTDTWTDAAITYTAFKIDVTDSASASGSLLMDLEKGATTFFNVTKDGFVNAVSGSAANPTYTFIAEPSTGWYRSGAGNLDASILGARKVAIQANSISMLSDTGSLLLGSSSDLALTRDGPNIFAQRNGINAQTYNIYNTFTDASNYERGGFKWDSNILKITTEALGSGTLRSILIGTSSNSLGFYDTTPVAQPSSTGELLGYVSGSGSPVNEDSTFTGNVGATAYTIGDIVKHLKNLGLIAQ